MTDTEAYRLRQCTAVNHLERTPLLWTSRSRPTNIGPYGDLGILTVTPACFPPSAIARDISATPAHLAARTSKADVRNVLPESIKREWRLLAPSLDRQSGQFASVFTYTECVIYLSYNMREIGMCLLVSLFLANVSEPGAYPGFSEGGGAEIRQRS